MMIIQIQSFLQNNLKIGLFKRSIHYLEQKYAAIQELNRQMTTRMKF